MQKSDYVKLLNAKKSKDEYRRYSSKLIFSDSKFQASFPLVLDCKFNKKLSQVTLKKDIKKTTLFDKISQYQTKVTGPLIRKWIQLKIIGRRI
jgi:hypothetical protein